MMESSENSSRSVLLGISLDSLISNFQKKVPELE